MRMWSVRLGLSLTVMVSVWTHGLPAQERIGMPTPDLIGVPPANWGYQLFVVPTVPYEPDHYDPLPPPFEELPRPGTARHRLMQLMNQHGYGCDGAGGWGCGSFTYDMHFFFGSCRDFFNQRCEPCRLHNQDPRYQQGAPGRNPGCP